MQRVKVGDMAFTGSAVSMGNPHLVLFVDEEPRDMPVLKAGPQLEFHESFPEKTNVEFVALDGDALKARVWERGSGETMACGTGACAVLWLRPRPAWYRRTPRSGSPGARWASSERTVEVLLTGPAERVFEGSLDEAWMRARGVA